jgi:hypothetical protein
MSTSGVCDGLNCNCALHVARDCWRSLLGYWVVLDILTLKTLRPDIELEYLLDEELRGRLQDVTSILSPDSFGSLISRFGFRNTDNVWFVPYTRIVWEKLVQREAALLHVNIKCSLFPLYEVWKAGETAGVTCIS